MPKPEWGTKRECSSCTVRFYDLGKTPIVCPKCGAVFELPARSGVPPAAVTSNAPKPDTTGGSDAAAPAKAHDEAEPLEDEDVDDDDFIDDNEDDDFKDDVADEK